MGFEIREEVCQRKLIPGQQRPHLNHEHQQQNVERGHQAPVNQAVLARMDEIFDALRQINVTLGHISSRLERMEGDLASLQSRVDRLQGSANKDHSRLPPQN